MPCLGGVNEGGGRMLSGLVANHFAGQLEVTRNRLGDGSDAVSAFESSAGFGWTRDWAGLGASNVCGMRRLRI